MGQRLNAFVKEMLRIPSGLFHCNLLYIHSLNSQDPWFPRPLGRPEAGLGILEMELIWRAASDIASTSNTHVSWNSSGIHLHIIWS